jgi:intracellular septation protein A
VNFKVFGISLASMAFIVPQVVWLSSKLKPQAAAPAGESHGR